MLRIVSGLAAGDKVLMSPPLEEADASAGLDSAAAEAAPAPAGKPDEAERTRERFRNMTPEQREALKKRMMERRKQEPAAE